MPVTTNNPAAAYNAVPYAAKPFFETHPDSLIVRALLAGHSAPPVDRCRVLEIGCATGINLVPMAVSLPGSTLVGIDISDAQIEIAQSLARGSGVAERVRFLCVDLMSFDPTEYGQFDFVIAHGVYSWVAAEVRDRLMRLIGQVLSRNGVAFVSFNTLPGWHLKKMLRDLMLYRVGTAEQPDRQIRLAREAIEFAGHSGGANSQYRAVMKNLSDLLSIQPDGYVMHEELEATNDPVYFHQFAAHAASHGLRHLTPAAQRYDEMVFLSPQNVRSIRDFGKDETERLQYLDFMTGAAFRQAVLVRSEIAAGDPMPTADLKTLHLASHAFEEPGQGGIGKTFFLANHSHRLSTADRGVIAAMQQLRAAWPATVPFAELEKSSGERASPRWSAGFADTMLKAYQGELVEFWTRPPNFITASVSDRPVASPVARRQIATGLPVVSLRHHLVAAHPLIDIVLPMLDGDHTLAQISDGVCRAIRDGQISSEALKPFGIWSADRPGDVNAVVRQFNYVSLLSA